MNLRLHPFSVAISILFFAAAAASQSVSARFEGGPAAAKGSTLRGTIVLSLPDELHVNSNKPNSEYAVPTFIRILSPATHPGLKIGEVYYPAGRNKKFQFSDTELNVYEGETVFNFTVTVPRNFGPSSFKLRAVVQYQACTEEVCFQPTFKEVDLTATVK
jgi:hypothetical protein